MSAIFDKETRYNFPMTSPYGANQHTQIKKEQLTLNEASDIPKQNSKSRFVSPNKLKKTEQQSLSKLKKQIQLLIDFQSQRIGVLELPSNAFSKNIRISENFQLLTLDGEPVPKLLLCKKCNQVRARHRLTSTPIVPHLKQHEEVERSRKMEEKKNRKEKISSQYAKYLTQSMTNSLPLPLIAKECGDKLSPYIKDTIVKSVLNTGDVESQKRLRRKLICHPLNKIAFEKPEKVKYQMGEEDRHYLEIYAVGKDPQNQSTPIFKKPLLFQTPFKEMECEKSSNSTDSFLNLPILADKDPFFSVNIPLSTKVDAAELEIRSNEPRSNAESSRISC